MKLSNASLTVMPPGLSQTQGVLAPREQPRPRRHLLTVALEDYFQVGTFNGLIERGQWYRFEPRLERNTRRALDLLDHYNLKATFFILGWIADQFPELVRLVAERGHDIASKGYYHRSIQQMVPAEFREALARSREALERASGKKVLGYRVAHKWFAPSDVWALDVLAEEGFAYDSSIGPLLRQFADQPWRRFVHQHQFKDRVVWEFPLSTVQFLGCAVPIAGGNYFRQFPGALVRRLVDHWDRTCPAPFVMYFHVWELDPEQPRINAATWLQKIRHYRNIDRMQGILASYFEKYQFTSIADYLGLDTRLAEEQLLRLKEPSAREPIFLRLPPRKSLEPRTPPSPAGSEPGQKKTVSVVVPCYNEELILPYLANTLSSVQATLGGQYDLRFLFVDDCSRDGTWNALKQTFGSWPNATVLHHERNLGVAAAILTGLRHAGTEVVCSIDCDCTYDPHELGQMIPLLSDGVDLVTASPYHRDGRVRNVAAWRLSLSRAASFLYRRVLRQKLATYTSCFRVYRRSALLNLQVRETGYLGVAETLAQLDLRGGTIVEYPTTLEVRMLGRSKMKVVRTIGGHLRLLTRLLAQRWRQGAKSLTPPALPSVPAGDSQSIPVVDPGLHEGICQ